MPLTPFEPDDIPDHTREPNALPPAVAASPLDALNRLASKVALPSAYRAALLRRVDLDALPWIHAPSGWVRCIVTPARARRLVAGVTVEPLQAPLRAPLVGEVGGREAMIGGGAVLAALVAAGVSPLHVWRKNPGRGGT